MNISLIDQGCVFAIQVVNVSAFHPPNDLPRRIVDRFHVLSQMLCGNRSCAVNGVTTPVVTTNTSNNAFLAAARVGPGYGVVVRARSHEITD